MECCKEHCLPHHVFPRKEYFGGSVQERCNSSVLAMELHLSCINSSILSLQRIFISFLQNISHFHEAFFLFKQYLISKNNIFFSNEYFFLQQIYLDFLLKSYFFLKGLHQQITGSFVFPPAKMADDNMDKLRKCILCGDEIFFAEKNIHWREKYIM